MNKRTSDTFYHVSELSTWPSTHLSESVSHLKPNVLIVMSLLSLYFSSTSQTWLHKQEVFLCTQFINTMLYRYFHSYLSLALLFCPKRWTYFSRFIEKYTILYSNWKQSKINITWWCHQMEKFSSLLALCEGNSPVTVEFPYKCQWRGALMFSLIYAWTNGE